MILVQKYTCCNWILVLIKHVTVQIGPNDPLILLF